MGNVLIIGLISFFTDISAEMVYPIIPLYLTSAFGVTPALIGIIEGIAESVASLLKVYSGYLTDRFKRKKLIAFFGYSAGLVYKIALIFAGSWSGVLCARVTDRIGKGIRTAPRDVMICESLHSADYGKAYGLHKAMDMAGSAIGIFLAYLLLIKSSANIEYKKIFIISAIPAIMGLFLFFFVREQSESYSTLTREPFWVKIHQLNAQLKLYLVIAFLFTLGNSSNAFLLLRAKHIGFNSTNVILLYLIYNVSASLLAFPMGRLSDKIGRKILLVGGYLVFALVYLMFGFAYSQIFLMAAFLLYGVYTSMITGVERAFIAEISPRDLKGTMLGFIQPLLELLYSRQALLPVFYGMLLVRKCRFSLGQVCHSWLQPCYFFSCRIRIG